MQNPINKTTPTDNNTTQTDSHCCTHSPASLPSPLACTASTNTQREIAEHLGITSEYLCAVFKKANEVSLIMFINQTKLSKIRSVMKRENRKLYEAAEPYGYSDPNYMSRLFKKYYGKNVTDIKA